MAGLLALLLAMLPPGPAAAGGYPEAEKAFSMGRLLVNLGDTTRGIFELKQAASIMPSPRYFKAIVEVYRGLGKDEQALSWGERYLNMTTPEERDEAIAVWLGQVRKRLRTSRVRVMIRVFPEDSRLEYTSEDGTVRAGVSESDDGRLVWWLVPGRGTLSVRRDGWETVERELTLDAGATEEIQVLLKRAAGEGDLVIESPVAGAEVRIDGRVAGVTPLEITRPAGRYVIQVWAKNHTDWTGFATVTPDKATRVQVYLTRSPGATAPGRQTIRWEPASKGLSLSTWGWITLGVGVAMGGAAGYTGWASFDRVAKAQKYEEGTPEYNRYASEMQSFWAATLALGSVGGAAVAGGLLMVLLDDKAKRDNEATLELLSFTPEVTPDGFTLNTGISF